MRVPRSLLVLSTLIVAIAACAPGDDNANGGLVGTSWSIVSIDGQATLADSPPTLIFAPDGLSGTTGCNHFGGTFRTDGDRIAITLGMMTEMACDGPRGDQEARVSALLPTVTNWRLRPDGTLELAGGASFVAVPMAAAAAPPGEAVDLPLRVLAGTSWILVEIGDTADLAKVSATLAFAEDGTVEGLGGCNRFSGPYAADGTSVTFGALATTKMACGRPADAVERLYLGVLGAVDGWTVGADGRLTLDGVRGPLVFVPG